MTPAEKQIKVDEIFDRCKQTMTGKSVDYASKDDVLANFRRNAEDCQRTQRIC